MKLCLFDSDPEAVQLWREFASMQGLQLTMLPSWRGAAGVPDAVNLLVVDQAAVGSSFEAEVLRTCRERPHMLVVATGAQLTVQSVVQLMRGGVKTLLEKPYGLEQLNRILPEMIDAARALNASKKEFHRLTELFASLTIREKNVLDCVLAGVSNKDTAKQLNVSVRTVESRRAKVYRKLELKHVAELVRKMDRLEQLHAIFETPAEARPTATFTSSRSHLNTPPSVTRPSPSLDAAALHESA